MRILVYNIAYGTGGPQALFEHLCTMHRYIRTPHTHLEKILGFIQEVDPDVLGLIEVDTGSYRTNYKNQVEVIANHISHHHHSSVKYGRRLLPNSIPILRKQANAVLTKQKVPHGKFHFFPVGFKRLIIEVEVEGIKFFLVHLALQKAIRRKQISHLAKLADGGGPVIIAGDFNTLSGAHELHALQDRLGLFNPNGSHLPTYPSWKPRKQLDFILCSKSLKVKNFRIPDVKLSDHLPLILELHP